MIPGGCDHITAPEHLKRAEGYFDQGDYQTAAIELKNVLDRLRRVSGAEAGLELFEAGILELENRVDEASAAYAVLAGEGRCEAVMRLAALRLARGETGEGLVVLDQRLLDNPADTGAQMRRAGWRR